MGNNSPKLPATGSEESILTWAFEHASDGMLVTDLRGVVTKINTAFSKMFGYSPEEVVGRRTSMLRSRFSTQEFYEKMWRSLGTKGEWKGEIVNRRKDGKEIICLLTINSIISNKGEKLGYFGLEIDLSDRKRLEDQVIQGEKLANIGESLASLVHELRNPINGISMNIFMLESNAGGHLNDEERESIHLIGKEVKRLESLVNDALAYARKFELNAERIIIRDYFTELKELLIYQAQDHAVDLVIDPGTETLFGFFDPGLIKQVILNLVQNGIDAASTSDVRAVRLSAHLEDQDHWRYISASGRVLILSVENSGPRITDEVRDQLFKPFFTTKKEKGLGLGLATSGKIVRQHHGVISHAHSEESPYTTIFTVILPK
jgi:PAS domain S-box-containing protein